MICDEPDAPKAQPWVHWVLLGIPGNVTSLAEGSNGGAKEGTNSWNRNGYGGPMPPPGHGVRHYHFKIYALKEEMNLEQFLHLLLRIGNDRLNCSWFADTAIAKIIVKFSTLYVGFRYSLH